MLKNLFHKIGSQTISEVTPRIITTCHQRFLSFLFFSFHLSTALDLEARPAILTFLPLPVLENSL